MARLTRATQKIFAGNATNNGVFGSLQSGNGQISNDVETIQSLPAYEQGWNAATISSELLPPLEEFQGVQYANSYQQAYNFQEGIPEWDSGTTYYIGSVVKVITSDGYQIYHSLTDDNTGNQTSDQTNWELDFDSTTGYALRDLSNSTVITNCITKIPQDIKLELSNGTLTLKAGSKIYVPNGAGKFNVISTQSDFSRTVNVWSGLGLITYEDGLDFASINRCFSGNATPDNPRNGDLWYDTANNIIQRYNGSQWLGSRSLPLAIIYASSTVSEQYIDQVFNGFGYIGNVFFRNNVSALLPNYRNSDGSLNNIVVNTTGVKTHEPITYDEFYYFHMLQNGDLAITFQKNYIISETEPPFVKSGCWYNPKTNIIWKSLSDSTSWTKSPSFNVVDCGTLKVENGRITSLKPNSVFQAVDRNEAALLYQNNNFTGVNTVPTPAAGDNSSQIATTAWVNSNVAEIGNNYIKLKNGLLMCWANITATSGAAVKSFFITFPKPFADTNWYLGFTPIDGEWDYSWYIASSSISTTGCTVGSRNSSSNGKYFVIGKGA